MMRKLVDLKNKLLADKDGLGYFIFRAIRMLAIVYLLFGVLFSLTRVSSESMESTLMTGDYVFGCRLSYLFSDPKRGDIIAFRYPVDEKIIVIKRIVGLPGETVDIENGQIKINGKALNESYIDDVWGENSDPMHFEVPEGHYFMMGDNRDVSLDSRYWAEEAMKDGIETDPDQAEIYRYVEKKKIITKFLVEILPFSRIGNIL